MDQSSITLDLRPILADGGEPFTHIMRVIETLPPAHSLHLLVPFRPVPLYAVMGARGFSHVETNEAPGLWRVAFTRASLPLTSGSAMQAMDWPAPVRWLDLAAPGRVRGAVARVLATVAGCAPGEVVFALFAHEPADVLARLTEEGHSWAGNAATDGAGYRLLVRRSG